ncbi:cobW-domain-containing protein [Serendipita vermifera]|nr:cobW-domain-containing protein [Serendipita vermifera]
MKAIPITVFTGFLGSGKTTTILSLLPQLPKDYKVVLLKNEFGDVEVDSQLAKQSSLMAVSEILNGCMCCILVGQMKAALIEIQESYSPDRIIIESSGSAFPATLAFQIRELEKETRGAFKLDAIVTVIDAENFTGYEDTSTTAKMQAAYTDVLLINKWENVSERQLDIVMDHLFTLNEDTPKIKCRGRAGVDPSLIFGIDSKLFTSKDNIGENFKNHHDEIETLTLWNGDPSKAAHLHRHDEQCKHSHQEADTVAPREPIDRSTLTAALASLKKDSIYRVKGFVRIKEGNETHTVYILNWAFERFDLSPVHIQGDKPLLAEGIDLQFTVMGERGEVQRKARLFADKLGANIN